MVLCYSPSFVRFDESSSVACRGRGDVIFVRVSGIRYKGVVKEEYTAIL